MKVPDELIKAAADRLNDYGNERDWQKMRPDEMAGIALKAVLPKVRERLLSGEEAMYIESIDPLTISAARQAADEEAARKVVNARILEAAFDHAFPEEGS